MEYRDGVLHIGGVSTQQLAEQFGTPYYVYDAAVIRSQAARLRAAFSKLPFRPFFAMKANGNTGILRLVRGEGFGCDAVSPGEIALAMRAGFQAGEIWFTCSNVSDDDLRGIPDPQIVINVNSMSEIDRLLSLDLPNPVALRVNPDIGAGHHHDVVTAGGGVKFGIDLGELDSARMVVEDQGKTIVGIHAHIGSGIDDTAPLLEAARRLVELAPSFSQLRWINFGGGIGVPYRPGDSEFPLDRYGEELAAIAAAPLRERNLTAILEPGRFLVAASGTLVSRVTSRRVSGGSNWLGCDTGFNHLVRPSKYSAYHHIVNASHGAGGALRTSYDPSLMTERYVVSGNLCESGDVFTRDSSGSPETRPMQPTQAGDLIAFCDAGAYGFSMASHYNARLLPPEILVDNGSIQLVRRRQSVEDLFGGME